MRFFLVDDDDSIRMILSDIIENEHFGEIVGEARDGSEIDTVLLSRKKWTFFS